MSADNGDVIEGQDTSATRRRFGVLVARIRLPLLYAAIALFLVGTLVPGVTVPVWVTLPLLVLAVALAYRIGAAGGPPIAVVSPVRGRWQAVNTPAASVPSHGLHAYAQTYALDLKVPHDGRSSRWWPVTRPPQDFPAFGRPVTAARTGTVVVTSDWQRDHRSRDSVLGIVAMLVEGLVREFAGPAGLLGNRVVLAHGDGTFTVYAHLRRRSLRVQTGDEVVAGQPLADCGNSGNSTEPHLHFQAQDRRSLLFAAGLPVAFDDVRDDGEPVDLPPADRPVEFGDAAQGSAGGVG